MTTDGTLFPMFEAGLKRKEEGMQAAINGVDLIDEKWKDSFIRCVESLSRNLRPFTSEDVIEQVGLFNEVGTNKNNSVGALMNACAKRGIIVKTGKRILSRRPTSNGAEITEWIGK